MSDDKKPRLEVYSKGKLGKSFFKNSPDFDLSDPNIPGMTYNDLHDPHLKAFFNQPERKRRLINQGLITHDNKVLCSLREYKHYEEYLKNVDMSWKKCLQQELRDLLKEFMVLKLAGEIPENTTCPDMRDWIMQRGEKAFNSMLEKILDPTCNVNVAWEVSHRDALEKLERETIKELQLEQQHHRDALEKLERETIKELQLEQQHQRDALEKQEQETIKELQLEQQHQLRSMDEIPNQSTDLVKEETEPCFIMSAWPGPSDPKYSSVIAKECITVPSKEAEGVEITAEVEKTSASTKTKKKKGAWAVLRRAWKAVKRTFSRTGRTKISPAD